MCIRDRYVYDKESDTNIALKFTHRLSKVVLKFMDMEKNPLTVSDVKILGMPVLSLIHILSSVLKIIPKNNANSGVWAPRMPRITIIRPKLMPTMKSMLSR